MASYWLSPITLKLYKETDEGVLYEHDALWNAMALGQDLTTIKPVLPEVRAELQLQPFRMPTNEKPL